MDYGYIRVSSREQNEARQLDALEPFRISRRNLYLDRQSGKDFERPAYLRLLARLHAGDRLIVKSIDRLGRNYGDILEQWRLISKQIGADILVLDMPLLDTRQGQDLTGTLISDIVLQLLSYVAQTERENIRQRQAEGIASARARGAHLGRPRLRLPEQFPPVYGAWLQKQLGTAEAAARLGVSRATFRRWTLAQEDGINFSPSGL